MMIVSLPTMRVLLLLPFLFISVLTFAQSSLSIEIVEAAPFVVYFNSDSTLSDLGQPIHLDSIPTGMHPFDIVVLDSVKTLLSSSVILYDGIDTQLLIENSSDSIQLLIPNQGLSSDMNVTEMALNSRTLQANVMEGFSNTCPLPMNRVDFNKVVNEINEYSFQRERVKSLNKVVGSNCLTTNQLDQLLSLIDDEGKKLDLIILCEDHIFDLRNAKHLSTQFILIRYQDQFNNWLIMVKNQG